MLPTLVRLVLINKAGTSRAPPARHYTLAGIPESAARRWWYVPRDILELSGSSDAPFSPIERVDGYLPIRDHGLIGDGTTAALVGRDGAVSWLCIPKFDSPPLFSRILDRRVGGSFTVAPEDLVEARQFYVPDSGVLVTEMRCRSGLVRVVDALTLRLGADLSEDLPVGRGELLRSIVVMEGKVRLRIAVEPYSQVRVDRRSGGFQIKSSTQHWPDIMLFSNAQIQGLRTTHDLESGDRLDLVLQWGPSPSRYHPSTAVDHLRSTVESWHRWIEAFEYEGPQEPMVRRSAITIKLLDYLPTGAIVAAPTSSLPEAIGGPRNWDYRYAWVRDAAFSVYALRRIGFKKEAWRFLSWVLDAVEQVGHPKVLYDLSGGQPPPEWKDPNLEGYRGSSPVRWGNGASDQTQHDAYGEIIDCAYQWAAGGGEFDPALWTHLRELIDTAGKIWRTPDHGIWEVRTPGRLFTYSVALCQVALDRGAKLAERFKLPGDIKRWRAEAARITEAILEDAWDPERNCLTEHLGGGGLDASLLSLPMRRVIRAEHPRMVATTNAIAERLGAGDGLIYRYDPDESPDGLAGHEGAFLLCSFWLVDNLAMQGRLEEAVNLYDSLCGRAGPLGLLSEQIDPETGAFLGNYPQGFSHIGVIASGINLSRAMKRAR
jgi:alpha,alpha-trehalase